MPLPKPLASSELAVLMEMKSKSSITQTSRMDRPCGQKTTDLAWKAIPVRRRVCSVLREQPGVQQTQKPTTHQHPSLTHQDSSFLSPQPPPNSAGSQFGGNDFLPPNLSKDASAISIKNYWSPLVHDDNDNKAITDSSSTAETTENRCNVASEKHRDHTAASSSSSRASGRCPDPRSMPSSKQRDLSSARPRSSGAHLPPNPRISASNAPTTNFTSANRMMSNEAMASITRPLREISVEEMLEYGVRELTLICLLYSLEWEGKDEETLLLTLLSLRQRILRERAENATAGGALLEGETGSGISSVGRTFIGTRSFQTKEFASAIGCFISGGVFDIYTMNNLPLATYWISFGRPPPAPNWIPPTTYGLGFVLPPPAPNWKQPCTLTTRKRRHVVKWATGFNLHRGNVLVYFFGGSVGFYWVCRDINNNKGGFYFFWARGVPFHHGLRLDEQNLFWNYLWDRPSFILRTTFEHLILCFDLRSPWPLAGYCSMVHWDFFYLVTQWNMFVLGALRQSNVFPL